MQSGSNWSQSSLSRNRSNVRPVAVPVVPKKGKRPDWTRLSNTMYHCHDCSAALSCHGHAATSATVETVVLPIVSQLCCHVWCWSNRGTACHVTCTPPPIVLQGATAYHVTVMLMGVMPWCTAAHHITVIFATCHTMAVLQTEPKVRKNKNKKERKTVTYHRCCMSCHSALLTALSPSQCCLLCAACCHGTVGCCHVAATTAGITIVPLLVPVCPCGMAGVGPDMWDLYTEADK